MSDDPSKQAASDAAGREGEATPPDPWEDSETAHLRQFLSLTYTQRFRLLMQAIEFMNMLRPVESDSSGEQ